MTLLSIREQEAVKEAFWELATDHETLRRAYESDYPDKSAYIERCKAEVEKSEAKVILATRDAIARQVRERNAAHIKEMDGYHNRAVAMTHENIATFIAELPCE